MLYRMSLAVTLLAVLPLGNAQAEWGDLTGTFVYDGTPPSPSPIVITKDQAFCGKHDLVDETVAVNPDNKGISGVVVYLYLARNAKAPEPHASYAETAKAEVHVDNMGCRYEPHVITLRTTQTLVVGNKDDIGHNTKIDTTKNVPINPIIPAKSEIKQQFTKEERLPVKVSCSIHPWMSGIIVIKDSPYMAVSDADGKFTIPNLPEGDWEFQIWHEAIGYVDSVKLSGKATKWDRGRAKFKIKAGDNDLGQILVPPSAFK